jgi:glucose-6-phosphate 1-dehydrogenase
VPFLIRTGKRLPTTGTEAVVEFHAPPWLLFSGREHRPEPNLLRLRLGTDDGITLVLQAKQPGEDLISGPVELDVDFPRVFGARPDAYQRLLGDAPDGDPFRFACQDAVEAAWRIVAPLLQHPGPVHPYGPGTWGPPEAMALLAPGRWWYEPQPARPGLSTAGEPAMAGR